MNLFGNLLQTVGAMIDGIHPRHNSQEYLGSADVRGSLVSPNMLLSCLESHTERAILPSIHRDADNSARHESCEIFRRCEERGMRSAKTQGDAESLTVPHCSIDTKLTWRFQKSQRHKVRGGTDEGTDFMSCGTEITIIQDSTESVGVLDEGAKNSFIKTEIGVR